MALDKNTIALSLGKGINTKSDPKQVVTTKLIYLQNCTFQKTESLTKRFGYGVLGNQLDNGKGNSITNFKNELIAYDGLGVYSYSKGQDQFNVKGPKIAVDLSTSSVVRTSNTQVNPDSTIHPAGYSLFAWVDSDQGLSYSIFDTATGQSIVTDKAFSSPGIKPKVKYNGQYIYLFYLDGNALKYARFDTASISSNPTLVTIGTCLLYYDVCTNGTNLNIVRRFTGGVIRFNAIDSAGALGADTVHNISVGPICIFPDLSNNVWVFYANGANTSVNFIVYDSTFGTTITGPHLVETISGTANVAGIYNAPASNLGNFYYEITNANGNYTRIATANIAGTVFTPIDLVRYLGIWSKPFIQNDIVYIGLTSQSTLQSTYFVTDSGDYINPETAHVIAKIAPDNGGGYNTIGVVAETNIDPNGNYQFAYEIKDNLSSLNGNVFTETGISSATLSFNTPIVNNEIGSNLHSSGAILSMYDGQNVVEHGYNIYPEDLTSTSVQSGGMALASYEYSAVYEWTDAQGQLHRSAPSVPLLVDTSLNASIYLNYRLISGIGELIAAIPGGTAGPFVGPGFSSSSTNLPLGFVTGGVSFANTTNIFTSTNSSASVNSEQITFKSGRVYYGDTTIGSSVISLVKRTDINFKIGSVVSGANVITLVNSDNSNLRVGMNADIWYPGSGGDQTIITSITGNLIGIQTAPSQSLDNFFTAFYLRGTGSATAGGNTISVSNASTFQIGDYIYSFNFNNTYATITNIVGTTITFSGSTWVNTVASDIRLMNDQDMPFVGDEFTTDGTSFAGTVKVLSVDSVNKTFTVDQQSIATVSSNMKGITGGGPNTTGFFRTASATGRAVKVPTLRVTDKQNVSIALYRTEANGSIFYRVSSLTSPTLNDKTIDYVTFLDQLPDAEIIGNEQLYTTGGVIENIEVPATDIISAYKSRLICVPSENKLQQWYSKQVNSGSPVEFTDSFIIQYPETDGDITAQHQMDDKWITFKKSTIFLVYGDGPASTGANNDFSFPQIISTDCGCIDKKSLVLMPKGLMFKSAKGIYLLHRNLEVEYIGADIEAYNSYSITSVQMIDDLNQIRYSLNDSVNRTVLVYDYYFGFWSVFVYPNVTGNIADSVINNNLYTWIDSNGITYQEDKSTYADAGNFIQMKLITAWFSLAQLQGYERAYKMLVLGDWKSPHQLKIDVAHNFVDTPDETQTIPAPSVITPMQYRYLMAQQKSEAFQVTITELQDAVSPHGEGLSLSGITFEIGIKKGLNKMAASRSYG